MLIKIYTNMVLGGWSPLDYGKGIGGSEEKLIEFAKHFAKKNDVTIYMNGVHGDFDGVHYRPHSEFKSYEPCDVFISFKARDILNKSINAKRIVHWTTEVEPQWSRHQLDQVGRISVLSDFHNRSMGMKSDKIMTDYLWVDFDELEKSRKPKQKGTMLYCSSWDRGLEELLVNWEKVKELLEVDTLNITYGREMLDNQAKFNPGLNKWLNKIDELLNQEGIVVHGKLSRDKMHEQYFLNEYWVLPLNNPQSELFCLNAIKAQFAGAIPVVRRIGALQETVNEFLDWDKLMGQKVGKDNFTDEGIENNIKHANKFNQQDRMEVWQEIFRI